MYTRFTAVQYIRVVTTLHSTLASYVHIPYVVRGTMHTVHCLRISYLL